MKKIKDFIYNTSDILVASLILIVAIGVIFWRMQAILNYPAHLLDKPINHTQTSEPIDPVVQEDPIEDPTNPTVDPEPVDPVEPVETPLWEDGKLTKDVTVTVSGNTATSAIQCLVEVGIYDSFNDFSESCKRVNRNHNNVRGGVKTFEAGMTKDEITTEMTFVIKK